MLFVRWDPDPSAVVQRTSTRTALGRTSGRFRAFVTHNRWGEIPNQPGRLLTASSVLPPCALPSSLVPALAPLVALALHSRTRSFSDSRDCQRQRKLSQPLMVFERGRSDAKDERIHAGQITILPLSRTANWIFSAERIRFRRARRRRGLRSFLPLNSLRPRREDKRRE